MATNKATRSRKGRARHSHSFAQFKGKTVNRITAHITDHGCAIGILFDDKTYLSFEVRTGLTILSDLSDWKTGNYKPLKSWRPVRS